MTNFVTKNCYLCDGNLQEGKSAGDEHCLLFGQRIDDDGQFENSLSTILSSALGLELDESTAHSKVLCGACNLILLEYENLEQQFYALRYRILTTYNQTAQRNYLEPIAIEINGVLENFDELDSEWRSTIATADAIKKTEQHFTELIRDEQHQQQATQGYIDDDTLLTNQNDDDVFDSDALVEEVKEEDIVEEEEERETIEQNILNDDDIIVDVSGTEFLSEFSNDNTLIATDDLVFGIDTGTLDEIGNSDGNNDTQDSFIMYSPLNNDYLSETPLPEAIVTTTKVEQNVLVANDQPQDVFLLIDGIYKCLVCENTLEIFSDINMFSEHMQQTHNTPFYLCQNCPIGFIRRQDLDEHMDSEHSAPQIKCDICGRHFNSHRQLRIHKRIHASNAKPFECGVCRKNYSTKNLLEEHMNTHIGLRPFKCTICPKDFASKYTLKSHMSIHTERKRPFPCTECDKTFLNETNLRQHQKLHLAEKPYNCNVCAKTFKTQHNLNMHKVMHSNYRPFVCMTCGKTFARRPELVDHERIHTGERPFQCDLCTLAFAQRSNLVSHKRLTHFNERQHKCDQCDRSYKRRRLLDYHMKAVHTGERPFSCDICSAAFVYPEHRKKHMLIHTGSKPYSCEVCGKTFNSRDNRNAHRFVHSNKKPYECYECGAGFMRKPHLLEHMKQTQHINDTIIVNQPQISSNDADMQLFVNEDFSLIDSNQNVAVDDDVTLEDLMQRACNEQNGDEHIAGDDNNAQCDNNVDRELLKGDMHDDKYLQFDELERVDQQTLTWADIAGDKD